MTWRALHIFLPDRDLTDNFLLQQILPQVSELERRHRLDRWFFIRYWENGLHVRLRVKDLSTEHFDQLADSLRQAVSGLVTSQNQPVPAYVPPKHLDGWHDDPSALPLFPPGTVVEIDYEPEVRRYGGRHGLAVNEEAFHHASRLAMRSIASSLGRWDLREALGFYLFAAAVAVACEDESSVDMLKGAARGWSSFASDLGEAKAAARQRFEASRHMVDRLAAGIRKGQIDDSWPAPAREFANIIQDCLTRLKALADDGQLVSPLLGIAPRDNQEVRAALASIATSQIHMMSNRLSLAPIQEYQFAQMLLWALEVQPAQPDQAEMATPES